MFYADCFFGSIRAPLQFSNGSPGAISGRRVKQWHRPRAVAPSAKSWRYVFVLLLGMIPMHSALGVEGIITEYLPGCSYFVVKVSEDYAVMEWNGHGKPDRNDLLRGHFSPGSMNILENATRGGKVEVWIESYPVSYAEAVKFYKAECQ